MVTYLMTYPLSLALEDYVVLSEETLVFDEVTTRHVITININDDNVFESSEDFRVRLRTADASAAIMPSELQVFITDDEGIPFVLLCCVLLV